MRAADLFSGLGGFTEGAEQAGHTVAFCANHWPEAVEWHERNHPDTEHACQDLMHVDWRILPDLGEGLLLASPACQDFSTCSQPAPKRYGEGRAAGRLARHQADRNTTWAVLACLDTVRPKAAIIENVVNLQHWALFPAWTDTIRAMGYHVTVQVVNGLEHGSAQDRARTLVVAHRDRPVSIHPTAAPRASGDVLDPLSSPEHRWSLIEEKSDRMRWRMRKAQSEAGSVCLWNNVSESRGRTLAEPLPTLTTKSGTQLYQLDGDRCRILNPRELARGQGFPDTYQIPTNRGLASKLIGNAIDVHVSRAAVAQVAAV